MNIPKVHKRNEAHNVRVIFISNYIGRSEFSYTYHVIFWTARSKLLGKENSVIRGNSSRKHQSDIYIIVWSNAEVRHEKNQYEKSCPRVIILFLLLQ